MNNLTHREEINLYEAVRKSFPKILVKDLTENERICPVCNGLGMRIENNIYGVTGDTSEAAKRNLFPDKHQAFSVCRNCFNGVQQLCPYCKQPYKNQAYLHCDCEGQKKVDEEERKKKRNEKVANAVEVDEKDIDTMLYCEETDSYYWDSDEMIDDWYSDHEDEDEKPQILWVTSEEKLHLDAADIVSDACEYLHEDAYDMCDIDSLQKLLDDWCKKQTRTDTYYPCYKQYVVIDWRKNRI